MKHVIRHAQLATMLHMSDTSRLQRILGCVVFVVFHPQEALFANGSLNRKLETYTASSINNCTSFGHIIWY